MTERRITSDMGTTAAPLEMDESRRVVPISTIVRMSLIACSFSTAYLMSRFNDLLVMWLVERIHWVEHSATQIQIRSGYSLEDIPVK